MLVALLFEQVFIINHKNSGDEAVATFHVAREARGVGDDGVDLEQVVEAPGLRAPSGKVLTLEEELVTVRHEALLRCLVLDEIEQVRDDQVNTLPLVGCRVEIGETPARDRQFEVNLVWKLALKFKGHSKDTITLGP